MLKLNPMKTLVSFFVFIFVLEWAAVFALIPLSPMAVGVIALVPAPVALFMAALAEGKEGVHALVRRSLAWRVNVKWYALAILIPVTIHLLAALGAWLAGASLTPRPGVILAYLPLTLILAATEEIGWQGYALPRLRVIFSPLRSAVIFGILHVAFHLPMFLLPLPAELRQASPFPLFLLMVISFAFYRVWFFEHTGGSVPLIIVFHTAINTSVLFLAGVEPELLGWLLPLAWILGVQPLLAFRGLRAGLANRMVPG